MMLTHSSRLQGAKFLSLWTGANLLGGFLIGYLESNGLEFMASLMLTGAIVGSLQWTVLRLTGCRFRWWPVASTLGWITGTYVLTASQSLYHPVAAGLEGQLGLSEVFWLHLLDTPLWVLFMALAQSLVLVQYRRWAGPWLLASLLGGVALAVVRQGMCSAFCQSLPLSLSGLDDGIGWAAYGLVTGIAWLILSEREAEAREV
ncbi:hypothetical protein [Sphaerothrix gracilis]|uniref:hypothetical protein n=1 Tax=Sphaerothrix gracilis TaxID=3151835 RepID=UPI0031FC8415